MIRPTAFHQRRLATILLPPLALLLLGWAWAFASPPGSAADDDFHMTSIWCAWGASDSCVKTETPGTVLVPDRVANASCFAFDAGEPATCTASLTNEMVPSTRINASRGGYPPVYYWTMRALVGPDVARSVLIMRMANVVLASALLALALLVAAPALRRALSLAWMVCLVPVGIFFIASMNPSSWAITGGALFWVFLLSLFREPTFRTRRSIVAGLGAAACTFLAMSARADSVIVLLLSMIAVGIVAAPHLRRRLHLLWLGLLAIPLIAVAAVFSVGRYLQFGPSFPSGNPEWDQPNAVLKALLELPNFLVGIIGGQSPFWSQRASRVDAEMPGFSWPGYSYGVGWTDVFNPGISGILILTCVAGVIFLGFSSYSRRKVIAIALLVLALVVQAILMRAMVGFQPTWFLQPRYFIAPVMVIVGLAALAYPAKLRLVNRGQATLLVCALTVAYSTSLLATIGRYTYGQNHSWTGLSADVSWWWQTGPSPIVTASIGTVAGLVWLWSLAAIAVRPHVGIRWRATTGPSPTRPSEASRPAQAEPRC